MGIGVVAGMGVPAALYSAVIVGIVPALLGGTRAMKGAYILNLTGGNPALASVGTNVTQRPMPGKTTLRRPHCN